MKKDIAKQIVCDLTLGVDGTNIRFGIIGEVGCTWPLTDNERKPLCAAGQSAAPHRGAALHPSRST